MSRIVFLDEAEAAREIGAKVWPLEGMETNKFGMYDMDDGVIQESIGMLLSLVGRAYESKKRATQELAKRNEDVLGEYKKEQERLYAGSIHTCTDVEWERYHQFWNKHYETCLKGKPHLGMTKTVHLTGTGIGEAIECECPVCHEKENITDYDCW